MKIPKSKIIITYINFRPETVDWTDQLNHGTITRSNQSHIRRFNKASVTSGSARVGVVTDFLPVLAQHRQVLLPHRQVLGHGAPSLGSDDQSPVFQVSLFLHMRMFTQMTDHMMTRLHETHFGSSVNSIPCTVVHSPIEVSSLSPDQLHLTPISTIDGRTATGHERGRRSAGGDGGGGGRPDGRHAEGAGGRHIPVEGGVRHIQLASTRLFPLGAAAPIDRMPHVQFRSNPLTITPPSFPPSNVIFSVGPPFQCPLFRPNGTIFDCELGCFIPLAEYQKRRSKESLTSVKEEKE